MLISILCLLHVYLHYNYCTKLARIKKRRFLKVLIQLSIFYIPYKPYNYGKCSFFTSEKILSIHKAQKRYSLSTYTNSRLSSFLNFTELISFSKQTQKAISLNFPQTIREIIFCRFFFNNLPYKIISFPLQ